MTRIGIDTAEFVVCSGCAVGHANWVKQATRRLSIEDFREGSPWRRVFAVICELARAEAAVNMVSIGMRFREDGAGFLDVARLAPCEIQESYFLTAIDAVAEASRKRKLERLGKRTVQAAQNGEGSYEISRTLIAEINQIGREDRTWSSLGEALADYDAFVGKIQSGEIVPIQLPFESLQEVVFYPGNVCVVGAHTSVGKTAFVLHVVDELARVGNRVLYISAEMSRNEMMQRMASDVAHMGIGLMREKRITLQDHFLMQAFRDQIAASGGELQIEEAVGGDERDIEDALDGMTERGGVHVLVLDYIQAISCHEKERAGPYHQMNYLSRWIRKQAAKRGMVVFLLSQLSRPGKEDRYSHREPTIWDLKESGNLENDADVVILLHRDNRTSDSRSWNIKIRVAKNRNGGLCEQTCLFDSWSARWE